MRPPTPIIKNTLARGLVVPAALVVTTLGPACPGPNDPAPASTSGVTEPATDPAPTSGGTTLATGTTAAPTSTGTGATTTDGELPVCSLYNGMPETCSSMIECLYLANEEFCIVRCNYFNNQAACEAATFCYWSDGCYLAV
jgi:hypothetical protein